MNIVWFMGGAELFPGLTVLSTPLLRLTVVGTLWYHYRESLTYDDLIYDFSTL